MKYGIELTERDIKLLAYLKEQGVATSEQLTSAYFSSIGYFRKRISRLIRVGLIESVPLSAGIDLVPSKMLEARQSFAAKGMRWQKIRLYRLAKDSSGGKSNFRSPLGEPIFWQHQLGLNDVRSHLSKILIGGIFLSDPEIKSEWAKFKFGSDIPIPDLVWKCGGIQFAIEYERTNKGEMKYFDRMARYQRSHYDRVLYVANSDDISDLLQKCSFRFPKVGITTRSSFDKVYLGVSGITHLSGFLNVEVSHGARA